MSNPLEAYVACTRLVFSVEPSEPSEDWEEFGEFEEKLCNFYENLLCFNCKSLLVDPCAPKKLHISCQHRVCCDCIGKNRVLTPVNCKLCRDFTLFEKSNQTKLVLILFKELCELIKGSWIYDYIQRRKKPDTGQTKKLNLTEIIENGINYGQDPIIVEDSSSSSSSSSSGAMSGDENSNSSIIKEDPSSEIVPYSSHSPTTTLTTFPCISPLAPFSPTSKIVQSPEPELQPITVLPVESIPPTSTAVQVPIVTQNIVTTQYQTIPMIHSPPSLQPTTPQQLLPSTSKITPNQALLKSQPSFISQQTSPMRIKSSSSMHSTMQAKSIMSPIKIQQQQQTTPTIYSVMYTGSGNKITLKRKAPSDEQTTPTSIASNESSSFNSNMNLLKTESTIGSNFKSPLIQMTNNNAIQTTSISHQQIPIVTSTAAMQHTQNLIQTLANNANDKRRGCRCGNATAAPGKLTCCGQRCPCYVDSKACIDCKCRGCRNPHFADGQKKMRHQVFDLHTQQQQQQNFLAAIQQSAMLKEVHKSSSVSLMKTEEINLLEQSTTATTTTTMISKNSINNCIISMNSNGQYQIKPRIIVKDPVKTTMTPIIFPTSSIPITTINSSNSSSIQILGLYSQVPMTSPSSMNLNISGGVGEKKIIIKNEISSPNSVMTFADVKLEPSATTNNLNSNLL